MRGLAILAATLLALMVMAGHPASARDLRMFHWCIDSGGGYACYARFYSK